jgi:transposase
MLIPSSVTIHLAREHVDFRKSIDGLMGVVRDKLKDDPMSGHVFVFHNGSRRALKILFWHTGGFCLFYKRLERGRFQLPRMPENESRAAMSGAELLAMMEGIDLRGCRFVPHWKSGLVDPWRLVTSSPSGSGDPPR